MMTDSPAVPAFDPSDPLLMACRRLAAAMHAFDLATAQRLGIGLTDLHAIHELEFGQRTAGQIAAALQISSGAVTALIHRLLTAGLIDRRTDEEDRRRVQVSLKPDVHRRLARIYQPLGRHVLGLTAHLDPRSRVELIAQLTLIEAAYRPAGLPPGLDEQRLNNQNFEP